VLHLNTFHFPPSEELFGPVENEAK